MAKLVKISYDRIGEVPTDRDIDDSDVESGLEDEIEVGGVREAVKVLLDKGCVEQGNLRDYRTVDPEIDYYDGTTTYYSCRLEGFTDKQLKAVDMLMRKALDRSMRK